MPATLPQSLRLLAAGAVAGMLSWAAAQAVSGSFEPYDSGAGLLANQAVLAVPAVALALRLRAAAALLYLLGAYAGMNLYAYGVGGAEARAWALLGALTSLFLLVVPALLVAIVAMVALVRRIRRAPPQQDACGKH